ncbi:hypothetical protein GCM10009808_16270 [Microbacterium sediminicola]|uniref:LTD domain-containing protein n=2 Tax=Microbacterium sediminicola TaxID=415210 RepID=A0ABN2I6B5_9MICO
MVAVPSGAFASTDGEGVIINEVYLKGGSANAVYTDKFVELYNPGDAAQSLEGWSLQYRSASGTGGPSVNVPLSGTIEADDYFLIAFDGNGANGAALPVTPDLDIDSVFNASGTSGTLWLSDTTDALTLATGSISGVEHVVDLIGYGSSGTFEGAVVPVSGSNTTPNSLARTGFVDTDVNSADFAHPATITPQASAGSTPDPEPTATSTAEPTATPTAEPSPTATSGITAIDQIQGTGAASPLVGQTVTTRGIVTAAYPTGGYNGFYIQTPGTGAELDGASDAVFVYGSAATALVAVGDYVEITATVAEYSDMTELTSPSVTILAETPAAIVPAEVAIPATEEAREALEGMLLAPAGDYTVTNTYSTNYYAEIGLAVGTTPLLTPTEVAVVGTPEYDAAVADVAARAVTLDDGASINFNSNANKGIALPWLTDTTVTVGAAVTFAEPMIFEYRNSLWKLQPTQQYVAGAELPATFSDVRTAAPENVGGDIQLATFNVLNYFTTTGEDWGCTSFYTDREGNPITVNSCGDAGPRGAADDENLARQQAKIVSAINALGAEVVSLEEIENSVTFGQDRDAALATLVDALNAALGSEEWAYVPSPAAEDLPAVEAQDVIRTAFIYKPAAVTPIGDSVVLTDSDAFSNARQPLAQAFAPAGEEAAQFVAIVNHFKSKSSSGASGDNADSGQGAYNGDRTRQAEALVAFADEVAADAGTESVFLLGDFNAYSEEDPIHVLEEAGYTDLGALTGEYSYSFSGQSGSLDHVLASAAALETVTGQDIWNINSGEAIALEYSRYNYNLTDFYDESAYRSSDHDPLVIGITALAQPTMVNLLNINDFHGRIDGNTVEFAGTIEQLRAEYGDENTLFLSAGDNIGASLFASAYFGDEPTIEVLNALELAASAVGNHEFDKGLDDLLGRVTEASDFPYLGANVYTKGTDTPVFPEYAVFDVDGVTVAVIGTVTEETSALVSPGGIADIEFGDPVEAVNRVAAQLTDGDPSNGEADVIVAEYHEGSIDGVAEGATLEEEIAAGGAFASIVTETSAAVDVIFTGHTHKEYAWDAPIPGEEGTRPIVQTGSYGAKIGQVVLSVDDEGEVIDYAAQNVARTTVSEDTLESTYPRVAEVAAIVDETLAAAAEVGEQQVGSVTDDITTAFSGGTYVDGVYTGGSRDNRAAQSTLGNLVADSLVASLSADERGGAEIGIVNPGGLRNELYYGEDGVITYAEANAVLPFVNNLWTTTLTGAQFIEVLEQQWQPEGSSRPYLALGLSDNVFYTYDETREKGDRITDVWIDGELIDLEREYRIGSFSFLLQGGDNFTVLAEGTDTRDSGLIDRDAWIDYITANSPLSPSFASRSAETTSLPTSVTRGEELTIEVSGINLTSLGAPENTEIEVEMRGSAAEFASVAMVEGTATVTIEVPMDAPQNSALLLSAPDSGTQVSLPLSVSDGLVELNLLNINDFHGRIDGNTVEFAGTIEQLREQYGEENTLFLSAGDNIGASLFASAYFGDEPTIEVLNALELAASAVGNHEFDKGLDDLLGRVTEASDFPYLGANVYDATTGDVLFDEYALFESNGVTVAVIGAVTEETPSLVSPGGIENVRFGDPVEAVNRVAAQLTDGDPSNGEADVIVAEYHEGSIDGVAEGATIEEEIAAGGAFASIVTETSAAVDVIFTGHTHKEYAWEGPIPGEEGTRPIIQTGSYGANIGQVVLSVDPATGEVVYYSATNVARTTTPEADLEAQYPRVAEVAAIVDETLAAAAEVGNTPVGSVTQDITTAFAGGSYVDGVYTGGSRDNRAAQSTLGNLVADSLLDSLSADERGGAEIAFVNPGGLRNELYYGADGVITYAEANAVLPFVNNLWTTTLTGAQVKAVLEQQWQPDGSSRPFLQLGVSDNLFYTFDDSRAKGDRITGVWIDGEPLVMDADYRVGSFSFLLEGGDNFTVLAEGADTRDSGLIDRDAWIEFITANSPLSPDFASRSAKVTGLASQLVRGATATFEVSGVNLTSQGSPENTTALVSFAGSTAIFDPIVISDGVASVSVTVPADAADSTEVVLAVEPSGLEIRIPVTVSNALEPELPETGGGSGGSSGETPAAPAEGTLTPAAQGLIQAPESAEQGQQITIIVGTQYAGQTVHVWLFSTPTYLGAPVVSASGTVTVTLPTGVAAGTHRLVVTDELGTVIGWQYIQVEALAATGGTAESAGVNLLPWAAAALLAGAVLLVIRRRTAQEA